MPSVVVICLPYVVFALYLARYEVGRRATRALSWRPGVWSEGMRV